MFIALRVGIILLLYGILCGCVHAPTPLFGDNKGVASYAESIQYSVQVGSFRNPNNAWRFVKKLNKHGLDAFLFKDKKTYKVRFGNYRTSKIANKEAKRLQKQGYFKDFFIVPPQNIAHRKPLKQIQRELYKSSYGYIGVPYLWGGMSEKGFDCSGLTYTIYRLNGISIPRTSRDQFSAGKRIDKKNLQVGDLVFFATKNRGINHVGIYVGQGIFIHAPSRGKSVKEANLNAAFWKKTYRGSRRYI